MTTKSPPGWRWRLHFVSRSPCQPAAHSGCRSSTRCPWVSWAPAWSRHRCEGLPEAAEDVSLNLSPVHTKDFYQTYLLKQWFQIFFSLKPPCVCPRRARPPPLSRCSGCEGHTMSFTTSVPLSRQTIAPLLGPLAPACGGTTVLKDKLVVPQIEHKQSYVTFLTSCCTVWIQNVKRPLASVPLWPVLLKPV